MKTHFHVPLDSTVRSKVWVRSKFATIRTGGGTSRDICDVIHSELHYICNLENFRLNEVKEYFWEC